MNGTPTHKTIFGEVPELKHNPDGSGTRDTNPLYNGKYTIEDFEADGKLSAEEMFRGPRKRYETFTEYDAKLRQNLTKYDADELTRYEAARAEAIERYTGQMEWPHGYTLNYVIEHHVITLYRYFTQYYELSDNKLADAMDNLIAEYAEVAAQMSADHETVLKAMDEDTEWPEMLEKANRALRIVKPTIVQEIEGKEDLAKKTVQGAWSYWMGWDASPDRLKTPKDWMDRVKSIPGFILNIYGRTADAMEHLDALGDDYGPLMDHIKKEHGKDWIEADRVSFEDMELAIIEALNYGKKPPQTITPEIEQRIREIIDEFGRPLREAKAEMEEIARKFNEDWDARTRAEIAAELEIPPSVVFLKDVPLSIPSNHLSMPINSFMQNSRTSLQQTFNDDGTFERSKDLILKSSKNRDNKEWLKANLMTRGYEPPSFAELGFIEQLGAEMEEAKKKGEVLIFTEAQLCKRRYGTDKRIYGPTCEKFIERMEALSNMKVLIPKRGGLGISSLKNEAGEYLGNIVGKEERLIEPTIEWAYTDDKKETLTRIFKFDKGPTPIHYINIWHGNIVRLNWSLIQTDPVPADKLSPKGRTHYDAENLRGNKRNADTLSLDSIKQADMKYVILHSIAYAYGFTQNDADRLKIDLEKAYQTIYRVPAPPKSSSKWKDYVKAVYTYLTFLIEKGAIEDYHPGKEYGKNSGTVFIDVDRGKKLLCPPE